jgi:hypothetical protein
MNMDLFFFKGQIWIRSKIIWIRNIAYRTKNVVILRIWICIIVLDVDQEYMRTFFRILGMGLNVWDRIWKPRAGCEGPHPDVRGPDLDVEGPDSDVGDWTWM